MSTYFFSGCCCCFTEHPYWSATASEGFKVSWTITNLTNCNAESKCSLSTGFTLLHIRVLFKFMIVWCISKHWFASGVLAAGDRASFGGAEEGRRKTPGSHLSCSYCPGAPSNRYISSTLGFRGATVAHWCETRAVVPRRGDVETLGISTGSLAASPLRKTIAMLRKEIGWEVEAAQEVTLQLVWLKWTLLYY